MPTLALREEEEIATTFPRESIREVLTHLNWMESATQSYKHRRLLEEANPAEVVDLLDFEVLFSYILPKLDSAKTDLQIANHLSAKAYLENASGNVALPPGTVGELNHFLGLQLKKLRNLRQVSEASSLEAALESYASYNNTDSAYHSLGEDLTRFADEASRLWALHQKSIQLLSLHLEGLSDLAKIMTRLQFFDIWDLFAQFPMAMPDFSDYLREIRKRRKRRKERFADRSDAVNMHFAEDFTGHLAKMKQNGEVDRHYVFRLITGTTILRAIAREASVKKGLTFYGPNLEQLALVVGTDEAWVESRLSAMFGSSTLKEFNSFKSRIEIAQEGFLELQRVARKYQIPLHSLIRHSSKPSGFEDRRLFLECRSSLLKVSDFFRHSRRVLPEYLDTQARKELFLAGNRISTKGPLKEIRAIPHRLPMEPIYKNLPSWQHFFDSINGVLRRLDRLGFHLTDFQRGEFGTDGTFTISDSLSLRNVGLDLVYTEPASKRQRWAFVERGSHNSRILILEKSPSSWVAHWSTASDIASSIESFLDFCKDSRDRTEGQELQYNLITVDATGREISTATRASRVLRQATSMKNISFMRLETDGIAFTSEIFSPLKDYDLRTGLMMKRLDIRFLYMIFSKISKASVNPILIDVIKREIAEKVIKGEIDGSPT